MLKCITSSLPILDTTGLKVNLSFQILFLEVSRLSFLSGSIKSQEGFVKKRHGDFRSGGCCRRVLLNLLKSDKRTISIPALKVHSSSLSSQHDPVFIRLLPDEIMKCNCRWQHCWRCQLACCAQLATQWGRRWLVVLDTAVLYVNIDTGDIISLFVVSVSSSDSFSRKNQGGVPF